jgi:polysaccharide biosynthesis/export protein
MKKPDAENRKIPPSACRLAREMAASFFVALLVLAFTGLAFGQNSGQSSAQTSSGNAGSGSGNAGNAASAAERSGEKDSYILGTGDLLAIHASNVPELTDKPVRIDLNGYINLPVAGRIQAGGLTVEGLEAAVATRLKVYLEEPDVSISITEYQSQPVSIFGEVAGPGVHQLQGRKTLVEMLALAGGLRTDAGPTVRITRRLEYGRVPLPGATDDPTGKFSVAILDIKPLVQAKTPEKDIQIEPYDIISVPRAELIYIAGDVTKSGPLFLADRSTMSIMEALSSTGGVTKTADTKKASILRPVPGSAIRAHLPVDIGRIMKGKSEDVELMAGDILVVPSSSAKKATQRALEAAIQAGTVILSTGIISGAL